MGKLILLNIKFPTLFNPAIIAIIKTNKPIKIKKEKNIKKNKGRQVWEKF